MTDQQSQASQADDAAQSQADTTDQQSQADQSESISLDEAKKLRSEAANLRKRLRDAESKVQAAEDAKKPELERLLTERDRYKADAERLSTERQKDRAEMALLREAQKANALDPEAIVALGIARVSFDEQGNAENVGQVIADLKKDKPNRFAAAAGSGDGGKAGHTPTDTNSFMNSLIRQSAGRTG